MAWNQGNGNGNQNGYGQQPQYGQPQGQGYGGDDVYGRLNNTREIGGARFPFLEDTGKYALCTLEEFQHSTDGPCARALLEVLETRTGKHAPGSYVVKIWKLVKPPKFQGQASDADQFADFCRKLKGAPVGYPIGNDIRVLMKERPNDQLARGTVIDAVAVPNKKGTWINVYWNNVQQGPQDIAQMRHRLESKGIPSTSSGPQGNGGQFQGAPHPSQMPGQYPAQQPGYGQQMPPQNAQYTQVGYGQPMPQQVQYNGPLTGAPPGGFLANVPPQGGQGNGGNQGGGPVGW